MTIPRWWLALWFAWLLVASPLSLAGHLVVRWSRDWETLPI